MGLLLRDILGSDGIQGESMSFLFRKRFEAVGCFDIPPDMPAASLDTQWAIWSIDAQLWRMAGLFYRYNCFPERLTKRMKGLSVVAEISDGLVLRHTSPKDDVRLYTLCAVARRHFQKGKYVQAFATLMDEDTWAQLNMVQYRYWSNEIWWLMMDIATRRLFSKCLATID